METKVKIPDRGAPNSRQVFKGLGVVEFNADGVPSKVWTRYGHSAPNPWLNSPLPKVTYFVGANLKQRALKVRLCHVFHTTYDGSTIQAEDLCVRAYDQARSGKRWTKEQSIPVGFPGGLYDRGHLIAAQFGAGMEAVNLVSMPSSVNRSHKPTTAARLGFSKIADLGRRYLAQENILKGTLVDRGEVILPNYRAFELVVLKFAKQGMKKDFRVSLSIQPSTVKTLTDVIHAEIWLEDKRIRYLIDCD